MEPYPHQVSPQIHHTSRSGIRFLSSVEDRLSRERSKMGPLFPRSQRDSLPRERNETGSFIKFDLTGPVVPP
jgi:hypothetical protein